MAMSQNGATVIPAYNSPDLVRNPIPGTDGLVYEGGLLRGDVDTVLRYVGAYWHRFIEPIVKHYDGASQKWVPQCWGYSYRPIRGQTSTAVAAETSNHSSGTATDTNSARHPLGTRTLTGAQTTELARLTIVMRGVVRFGAFYRGRPDEMHSEVVLFGAPLERLAADIRAGRMEVNFPELVTEPTRNNIPAVPSKPQTTQPAAPADWWDTVDDPTLRAIISQEVAKVLRSEGVTGAGDAGRLGGIIRETLIPVLRSEGVSGAADTGALIARLVPALRAAGVVALEVDDAHIRSVIAQAVAQ